MRPRLHLRRPAADFALALRLGQGTGEAAELKTSKKCLGVTDREVDHLCSRSSTNSPESRRPRIAAIRQASA